MSADRPPKRQASSDRDSVSPQRPASQTPANQAPAKDNRAKSRTADNLEALLHLLDEDDASVGAPVARHKARRTPSGRATRPAPEKTPVAGEASPFMQELARARADLHKERRARIAWEEEVKSLRSELTGLGAHDSAKIDELSRDCEGLRKQLAAVEKQRQKLNEALLDAESQLDAEQEHRELLIDQVDALRRRLAEIEQRPQAS